MTLKEKFNNVEICIESQLLNLKYDENMNCVDECIEIAESFAIKFARYIAESPKIFNNGSSMEQALSLFKIENKL